MDGSADDLELLLASADREIATLRGDPRMTTPARGSRGTALHGHVLDLLGAVECRIAREPAPDAPLSARRAFARHLRQSIVALQGAHAALPWLAATKAPYVNLGSLYLAEELAQHLVGNEVDLVVGPDPEFMYSTTSWPFAAIIEGTDGFKPHTARRPIVLNYPLTDGDRLLLHPVFAHELSHASVDEHDLVSKLEAQLDDDSTFTGALEGAVNAMKGKWASASPTQIAGTLRVWLRDWIEELLCDHLALETMGPAFLWSFAAFAMPLTYGEPGETHPANTVRVRMALSHLDRRGWRSCLERVAPKITAWLDGVAADAQGPMPEPFAFFRDQLLSHERALQSTAVDRVGDGSLAPETCESEAHEAADLLMRLILPVGLDGPLQPRSILLSAEERSISGLAPSSSC